MKTKTEKKTEKKTVKKQEGVSARLRKQFGLYNMQETTELLGVDYVEFRTAVEMGFLPAPETKLPGQLRRYYTKTDIETLTAMVEAV